MCEVFDFSQVHLKREIRPKRDIVDTSFHASRGFGHDPTLGLGFSYSWEKGSARWEDSNAGSHVNMECRCWPIIPI